MLEERLLQEICLCFLQQYDKLTGLTLLDLRLVCKEFKTLANWALQQRVPWFCPKIGLNKTCLQLASQDCFQLQQDKFANFLNLCEMNFNQNCTKIVSANNDNTVNVWSIATGECMTLQGHKGWVYCAQFSPDGTNIVSASSDKTVRVWRAHTGDCVRTFKGHDDWVISASCSPRWDSYCLRI